MKPTCEIVTLLIAIACLALSAEPSKNLGIAVTLHDSHGVSSASAQNHVLELILFRPHTHMHFKISNTTDQELTLWRPYCPEGDAAMSIEFREASVPDKVFRAHTGFDYTGGMGIPKVFTLAARDDLIVNVDFQSEWILPFAMEVGQIRELQMRAVYRSQPLTDDSQNRLFKSKEMQQVWSGVATSNWQKVRIINRTGERFEQRR
jgi:hypothetical protein